MGFATFAELLAAKAGKAVPQIEESMAKKVSQVDEAKMLQQLRDFEHTKALEQRAAMPPAATPLSVEPKLPMPDEIIDANRVPSPLRVESVIPPSPMSVEGRPGSTAHLAPTPAADAGVIELGPKALNPSAGDISDDAFKNFNKGKLDEAYSLKNNKGKVALAAGGGALASAYYANKGDSSTPEGAKSIASVAGPAPASVKPVDPTKETPGEVAEKSSFKRMLSWLSPEQQALHDMTALGGTTLGSDENLKAAMAQRDTNRNMSDITRGAQLMGSGMSGTDYGKTGGALLDEKAKLVDQPIKDLEKRVENQENDPNSTASVAMRGLAEKMGFKFGDKVSAADIKKQIPQMASITNSKELADARKQAIATSMQARQDAKADKLDQKNLDFLSSTSKSAAKLVDGFTSAKMAGDAVRNSTGKNPAEQVTTLYSFVKTLDPGSAVKEGEVALSQSMASVMEKAQTAYNKVLKGEVVGADTVSNINQEILRLEALSQKSYNTRMGIYREQIKQRGLPEDSMKQVDPYYTPQAYQSAAPVAPAAPSAGRTVRMRAPDGSMKDVPEALVPKYEAKGGKRV